MPGPLAMLSELADTAGRVGGQAADILKDRLELLALELREDKIRLLQVLMLAFAGTALLLFGLMLLVVAGVYALPEQWRLVGIVVAAAVALLSGCAAFRCLKKRLGQRHGVFAQSMAELEKDKQCF